jgi:hypothetical protein
MRIIPGAYCLRTRDKTHKNPFRLVSVKAAKSLAIEIHGSAKSLVELLPERTTETEKLYRLFKRYHEAPVEAPRCDMSKLPENPRIGSDRHAGVSSLRVPYITATGADWGQVCKGCQVTYKHWWYGGIPWTVISRLFPLIPNVEEYPRVQR